MEEEKAAAYYEELTRKGSGAARFKQGLGFSSATDNDPPPPRGSALPSSSFMSNFVKASTPNQPHQSNELVSDHSNKKTQLLNIQNKLKKKDPSGSSTSSIHDDRTRVRDTDRKRSRSRSEDRDGDLRRRRSDDHRERSRPDRRRRGSRDRRSRSRSRSRSRRRRSRSRSRSRSRTRTRRTRRSRSRSRSRSRRTRRSRSRSRRRSRSRSRNRSCSPRERRGVERGRETSGGGGESRRRVLKEGNGAIDYSTLIHGYDNMTPAERVKAKMKLQLSQTAEKDTKVGSGSHWERFDFNKDAPLDDNEIEATDDDASLVKHIGQSFRFTSLEAKRENQIENAHDEAMFGVPVSNPSYSSEPFEDGESENENENDNKGFTDEAPASSLINEKVLWKQQGSWRDRAGKKAG